MQSTILGIGAGGNPCLPRYYIWGLGGRQTIATYIISNIYVMFYMEYVLWKEKDKNRNRKTSGQFGRIGKNTCISILIKSTVHFGFISHLQKLQLKVH